MPVTAVYVAEGAERDGRPVRCSAWPRPRHSLLEVARVELDRLTAGATHQGLAARVPAYQYAPPTTCRPRGHRGRPRVDRGARPVTEPRNSARWCSAQARGARCARTERRSAGMTTAASKTSAGAAARVPVAQATNLTRQLKAYQEAGGRVGLTADGRRLAARTSISGRPTRRRRRLRGQGPLAPGHRTCDRLVSIPHPRRPRRARLECLNASVAASLAATPSPVRRTR